ncbi:MAG TPA: hypothetical protein VIM42_04825 [Clostridium sp.]
MAITYIRILLWERASSVPVKESNEVISKAVLTKENDEVEIKYLDIKDNNVVPTIDFKNNNLK